MTATLPIIADDELVRLALVLPYQRCGTCPPEDGLNLACMLRCMYGPLRALQYTCVPRPVLKLDAIAEVRDDVHVLLVTTVRDDGTRVWYAWTPCACMHLHPGEYAVFAIKGPNPRRFDDTGSQQLLCDLTQKLWPFQGVILPEQPHAKQLARVLCIAMQANPIDVRPVTIAVLTGQRVVDTQSGAWCVVRGVTGLPDVTEVTQTRAWSVVRSRTPRTQSMIV